jgi:hypothetical protein
MAGFEQVRGRRVAVVGRAASILGSGHGPQIDGFDLVVRINALLPLDPSLAADIGTRTDVVYHCLGCRDVAAVAQQLGVSTVRVDARYREELAPGSGFPAMLYRPFTGTVAIFDVLRHGAAAVWAAGMDLGATGHSVAGSRQRWRDGAFTFPEKRIRWCHDPAGDRVLLAKLAAADPRFTCDAALAAVLRAV